MKIENLFSLTYCFCFICFIWTNDLTILKVGASVFTIELFLISKKRKQ